MNLKLEIDNWLESYLKDKGSYNKKVYEAMYYSLSIGGKRIRPMLLLLSYSLYKDNYKDALPLAAAIEMIHTYSLIHDDLPCMDNDDLRRGKPTNHKIFGEALAILAGDALLNEAMNIMFKYSLENGNHGLKASYTICKAAGADGMIGGQVVDILGEGHSISKEELNYMHEKKTGELILASILAGAIAAEAPENELKILESFGKNLGLAFQIRDDILDVLGDEKLLGKTINKDITNKKSTFVTTYGIDKCKSMCEEITNSCIKDLNSIDRNTHQLEKLTLELLYRDF